MEENNYKQLLKKINGKNLEEVRIIVNNDVEISSKLSYTELYLEAQDTIERLEIFEDFNDVSSYSLFKNEVIFESVIKNFTNLEVLPEDIGVTNHNMLLEIVLKENAEIDNYYKIVNSLLNRKDMLLIQELNKTFNSLPNAEGIEKMKEELSHIFDEAGEEKLQQINSILEFNDPAMKLIKDSIHLAALKENGVEEDGYEDNSQ